MEYLRDWDEVIKNVRGGDRVKKVVVASAQDDHCLEAVAKVAKDGLVCPVLVGDGNLMKPLIDKYGLRVEGENFLHRPDPVDAARASVRLIKEGKGDFLMKGSLETAQLLKAVVDKENGLGKGRLMSHVSFQRLPAYHKMLLSTDGGMVLYPDLAQKKEILQNAVDTLLALGYEKPKVAVLAAVEKVNPKMPESVDAEALKTMNRKGEITGCVVEGPISMDLALVREKAAIKKYESPVAGEADILLVPNIVTGNCVGKAFVEMAGAKMAGLIVGAKVPIVVTSRASSAEEKYLSLILAAAGA
ncbi:MAG: bifunctional enoyl-CoA hydratase/phosphate acetyltransferase [Deltaproteobacteria bacterium]|jgi:phosphate butyryltransferase|nr:bifunctional enoyl-CoA hydratase/phosphate acetyltransferase [Deltaproteobacteria bacterium]